MSRKLLCLPGYLQNGKIFAEKSSGIRKILTKKHGLQLDYIDPPIIIEEKEHLPFTLAIDEEEAQGKWQNIVSLDVNRCWWQHKEPGNYEGFDESLQYVLNYIKENGPYDGIIGFSQGGAMAAIITNHISKANIVTKESNLPQNEFSVGLFISGFVFVEPKDPSVTKEDINHSITDVEEYSAKTSIVPEYAQYFTNAGEISTKVIGLYGSEDSTVPPIRSKHLMSLYNNSFLFEHDGGHYVPNKKQILQPIIDVFTDTFKNNL